MSDPVERQAAIDGFWQLDIEIRPSAIDAITKMLRNLPSAEPKIIRCKDCIHKPRIASETGDVGDGFDIEFPDGRCPCQCSDEYYNWMPHDDWFCGNGERRTDGR